MNHNNVRSAVLVASIPGDVESVGIAVERHPAAPTPCATARSTASFCSPPCIATRWRTTTSTRCSPF
jgi:hypothetical protein